MIRPARPRSLRGLTLIELMVALAIFAVLGVLSYRALAEVSTSRARLGEDFQRWREIGRTMQRIDTDLLQIVSPGGQAGAARSPALSLSRSTSGEAELQFMRLDDARGVRRCGFRLDSGHLDWLRWTGRDAVDPPTVVTLLERVAAVRWFFLKDNVRSDAWPPAADQPDALPDAVILELDLPEAGTLTRVFALR
jgi:general secretion pathway protein J